MYPIAGGLADESHSTNRSIQDTSEAFLHSPSQIITGNKDFFIGEESPYFQSHPVGGKKGGPDIAHAASANGVVFISYTDGTVSRYFRPKDETGAYSEARTSLKARGSRRARFTASLRCDAAGETALAWTRRGDTFLVFLSGKRQRGLSAKHIPELKGVCAAAWAGERQWLVGTLRGDVLALSDAGDRNTVTTLGTLPVAVSGVAVSQFPADRSGATPALCLLTTHAELYTMYSATGNLWELAGTAFQPAQPFPREASEVLSARRSAKHMQSPSTLEADQCFYSFPHFLRNPDDQRDRWFACVLPGGILSGRVGFPTASTAQTDGAELLSGLRYAIIPAPPFTDPAEPLRLNPMSYMSSADSESASFHYTDASGAELLLKGLSSTQGGAGRTPAEVVQTSRHVARVFANGIQLFGALSRELVAELRFPDQLEGERFVDASYDAHHPDGPTTLVVTNRAVYELVIPGEETHVWRQFLAIGDFFAAELNAEFEFLPVVFEAKGFASLLAGDFAACAEAFAKSNVPFARIGRLLLAQDASVFSAYCQALVSALHEKGREPQTVTALAHFALESLLIARAERLRMRRIRQYAQALRAGTTHEKSTDPWEFLRTDFLVPKHLKATAPPDAAVLGAESDAATLDAAVLSFLEANHQFLSGPLVTSSLTRHGATDALLQFAEREENYSFIVRFHMAQGRTEDALRFLAKMRDPEDFYSLVPFVAMDEPRATVELLINVHGEEIRRRDRGADGGGLTLSPGRLVETLMHVPASGRYHVMRYLRFCIFQLRSTEPLLHNHYIALLAAQGDTPRLLHFLARPLHAQHFDRSYAIDLFLRHGLQHLLWKAYEALGMLTHALDALLASAENFAAPAAPAPDAAPDAASDAASDAAPDAAPDADEAEAALDRHSEAECYAHLSAAQRLTLSRAWAICDAEKEPGPRRALFLTTLAWLSANAPVDALLTFAGEVDEIHTDDALKLLASDTRPVSIRTSFEASLESFEVARAREMEEIELRNRSSFEIHGQGEQRARLRMTLKAGQACRACGRQVFVGRAVVFPCGHVFCVKCIRRAYRALTAASSQYAALEALYAAQASAEAAAPGVTKHVRAALLGKRVHTLHDADGGRVDEAVIQRARKVEKEIRDTLAADCPDCGALSIARLRLPLAPHAE
eukprot:gnl/Chilomastix_cuspidata/3784.p1 GENE.gnl/Chilomastix_cuspidata/3784~~gnl/Chilomastix_cuspidata/3784.p1  ORF type:complete len:1160 (-),score=550.49 gnl/Chilomastix_cuspidata/3784:15-3494(-)